MTAAPQDIVERLHAHALECAHYDLAESAEHLTEAADEIERLREWQRRAWVVIECPSSDTIQDELKWLREESKP